MVLSLMKKLYSLTFFIAFWLCQQLAVAQNIPQKSEGITHQTGLKAGLNFSQWVEGGSGLANTLDSYRVPNGNIPGLQIGIWHQLTLSKKTAVVAELYLATKGRTYKYIQDNVPTSKYERTTAITLPVLFRYQLLPKLSIEAGPAVNYIFPQYISFSTYTISLKTAQLDISAMGGLLYQINRRWSTDLRYEYGFSSVLSYQPPGYKQIQNRSLQLSAQYQLGR